MTSYLSLKQAELDWFKDFCPDLNIPQTFDPLTSKFTLMKELKARTLLELKNSVTLLWPLQDFHGLKVHYRYQRQDFTIQGDKPLEVFYPGLKASGIVTGHFTRSGQSATFGLNLALKNWDKGFSLRILTPRIYFESIRIFEGLIIDQVDPTALSGFLDSSFWEKSSLENLPHLKRLIVDTTNWSINSEHIQEIINWAESKDVELFLIRSHLKLDCLGAEYGLLGSVVRIGSQDHPEWEKFFLETLSYAGLLAVQEQLYPFHWDKRFRELSTKRTERIRQNTRFLTEGLNDFLPHLKNSMELRSFEHGLFFLIYYKGQPDYFPDKFLKLSMLHEVPARHCDSFGFDFFSLTNVVSFYEKTNESAIRFCSGDNTEKISDVLELMKDYLVFFDQQI